MLVRARWLALKPLRLRTFLFDCHTRPERCRELIRAVLP